MAFDKLHKVLEACDPPGEGFGTPAGREFVGILSKVLLPNPQYCQRSSVATFQGEGIGSFVCRMCVLCVLFAALLLCVWAADWALLFVATWPAHHSCTSARIAVYLV